MVHGAESHDDAVRKLGELIKDIRVAMLTTAMPDGMLRSRPMAAQSQKFDGTLWFFCDAESAKVYEVRQDQHVNVSFADPGQERYVSISGLASVVRDREKARELWTLFHKAYFPNGPDDPNLVLLKVEVDRAEYWDAPSRTMTHIIGLAKALMTGHRYVPGDNEKLDFATH